MTPHPQLSVVLPVYAAGDLARESVATLMAYLDRLQGSWEIVVVDDGGNDFEASPLPDHPGVRVVRHPQNLGKGAAVRTGMLAARGDVRLYTDVDLPYDLHLIPTLASHVQGGFHLAIGDRTLPGSTYAAPLTASRRVLSAIASQFIGSVVTGGFHDTQCGIKAFRADVAEELFRLATLAGFSFDVEVIYIALKHRLDIKRVPVQLRRNASSSVRVIRDSLQSASDLLGIKVKQLRGRYHSDALHALVVREAEEACARFADLAD